MPLTERERIEILMMIGVGDSMRTQQEVCRLFHEMHPESEPISQSTVSRIERKYRELGHVRDAPKQGRPKVNENIQQDVILSAVENPHCTVRGVSRDLNIGKSSVSNIFKKLKYHPYKVRLIHELAEDDFDRRTEFCEYMMDQNIRNNTFIANVLFSDEATFYLNGHVNRQNTRYWSQENPHWMQEYHTQRPQKVNVWAGIVRNTIVGPYFFDENLTGALYLNFLQNKLIPDLTRLFPDIQIANTLDSRIWFQQDGAPPHFAVAVREFLHRTFPDRWIGRRGTVEWPARSPDLTPLDFFLWGYLKSKVYTNRPGNIRELKDRIRQEMLNITPAVLQNVRDECIARFAHCLAVNGEQFEHLL